MTGYPPTMLRCANSLESKGFRSRSAHWLQLLACVMAALVVGAAYAEDDLPGRVGRVADVAGELFLAPQDKPDQWSPIGLNYPVASGDNVWAGRDSRAEIDFGAGQLRLSGDTNLHVSRLDDRQFAVFVAQGHVNVRVRVLDPGEAARVDTPNAQVVLTRPGSYRVDVSEDREHTLLVVREGEANVLTSGAVQQVLPGQTASVDGADAAYAVVRNGIGNDPFDAWAANRDRYYDGSRANNYVSPQMVGAADLDQYGTWTQAPEYGAVWYPNNVAPEWAPYRDGYWADVGAWGPTWVDAAPWGYAPFHYGRWAYIGNRWGWCPGRYVARPLWAPALVGWAGGAGWGLSASLGAPVYGWVPLAWGEPFRPWWGRCSQGCWDRYNRPYAVNVAVVRPNSPPPTRYANWNAPGGVSAMSGAALIARKPVQANLVKVPGGFAANAPILAGAPLVRAEPGRIPTRRAGDGTPPPASTFYPTNARPTAAGGPGSAPGGVSPGGMTGNTRARVAPAPMPSSPASSFARQAPAASAPAVAPNYGGMAGATPVAPSARSAAPGVPPPAQGLPQAPGGMQGAVPVTRNSGRALSQTPTSVAASPQQGNFPPPSNGVAHPMSRPQPAPAPLIVAPTAPMIRSAPAPVAPMVVQQPHNAPQPASPPVHDGGNVTRKDDRGQQGNGPNPDRNSR